MDNGPVPIPVLTPLLLTALILLGAMALLLSERLRADLVALLVVVILGLAGVLTPQEAFSGFGSPAVITLAAIFILAEMLRVTGAADKAGDLLLRVTGTAEARQVAVVMLAGAVLSLFMNNVAAAAILLPAVAGMARKSGTSPGRLLMPLAFGTLLGGMATLFTTTNLVVSGILRDQGLEGFGVLDFLPVGGPMTIAGLAYMVLWGRRLLPRTPAMADTEVLPSGEGELEEVYRLGERLFRARVTAGSQLAGKSLAESRFREGYGVSVVAIERGGQVVAAPGPEERLAEGDVLVLAGREEEFRARETADYLELLAPRPWHESYFSSPALILTEAILAPRSTLLGRTLGELRFREKYGMTVLGIWRAGRPIRTNLSQLPLQFGDALLLLGPRERLNLLRTEPDLVLLRVAREEERPAIAPGKRRAALLILAVAVALAAFQTPLVGEIMLGAALAAVLFRLLTLDQAYAAIEWRSVFLVAGMLSLGVAMTKSGTAAVVADRLVHFLEPYGPLALLAGLFLLTTLMAQTMHGAVVATILAPVALQAAGQAGVEPRALAMGVALATSMAFLTPLGHPVNVLVMGPGGYRLRDYLRVGLPLTVLLCAVAMVVLPVVWPLAP